MLRNLLTGRKAGVIRLVCVFYQHHEVVATVCSSKLSEGRFLVSSKIPCDVLTGRSHAVVSWQSEIPQDAFLSIFCLCSSRMCGKYFTRPDALNICHTLFSSCADYQMRKAGQHLTRQQILLFSSSET